MKETTKRRKKARHDFEEVFGKQHLIEQMSQVFQKGKQGLDAFLLDMGKMMAETIMYIDREELSGPDYSPYSSDVKKWASQKGSIYLADQKLQVNRPRLRGPNGEISLESYQKLKLLKKGGKGRRNYIRRGFVDKYPKGYFRWAGVQKTFQGCIVLDGLRSHRYGNACVHNPTASDRKIPSIVTA